MAWQVDRPKWTSCYKWTTLAGEVRALDGREEAPRLTVHLRYPVQINRPSTFSSTNQPSIYSQGRCGRWTGRGGGALRVPPQRLFRCLSVAPSGPLSQERTYWLQDQHDHRWKHPVGVVVLLGPRFLTHYMFLTGEVRALDGREEAPAAFHPNVFCIYMYIYIYIYIKRRLASCN